VAASTDAAGTAVYVRSTTDPTGTWGTALSHAVGGTYLIYGVGPVAYDGTTWAFSILMRDTTDAGNTSYFSKFAYATDPTGTWSFTTVDTADPRFVAFSLRYLNGEWVQVGFRKNGTSSHPSIGTSSSVTGTWTYDYTDAGTGTTGGTSLWNIADVERIGSTYAHTWFRPTSPFSYNPTYASSLGGTWTASTASQTASALHLTVTGGYILYYSYSASGYGVVGPAYSSDGETYTLISAADSKLSHGAQAAAYNGEYWLLGGATFSSVSRPRVSYLLGSSPDGAYTLVDPGLTSGEYVLAVDHDGDYFVAMDAVGMIRYSLSPSPAPPTTGPTYLRLHQSPVMAPSRVRGVDIRNRQTPIITK
jgi:hypothetical protein